jgi:hypothetical protein
MWIAMGGFLGLTVIVSVFGLLSASASRKQRLVLHRHTAQAEAEKRRGQTARHQVLFSEAAMKEAASGSEEEFAQISGNTR